MTQPLGLAEIPPNNVWELYIWFLFIPFLLRGLLLARPFLSVTKQLAPHGGWVLKRLKELPVRGYTLLAVNEILAFSLPILVVLIFRYTTDPLGWQSWGESNWLGLFILFSIAMLWLLLDFFRIMRVRRMLKTIQKQNIERLKVMADTGFKLRNWLRKFSRKDKPQEVDEDVRDGRADLAVGARRKVWLLPAADEERRERATEAQEVQGAQAQLAADEEGRHALPRQSIGLTGGGVHGAGQTV